MLFRFAKTFCRALLMSVHVLVLSYNRMTNLSMVSITSSGMSLGAQDNCTKAPVPQHLYLLSGSIPCDGHSVLHGLHAATCGYQLLHGYKETVR